MPLLYTICVLSLYGIILTIAGLVALSWWYRRAPRFGISTAHVENVMVIGLPLVVVGARFHHVLTDWHVYADAPISAFFVWRGGLGLWGAVAGGLVAILVYARRADIDLHVLLNSITPPVLLAMTLGRWANVANNELLPFAYIESLAALGILAVVLILEKKAKWSSRVWCIGLGLYSVARFFGELVRTEPWVWFSLTVNQIVSLFVLLTCCAILYRYQFGGYK